MVPSSFTEMEMKSSLFSFWAAGTSVGRLILSDFTRTMSKLTIMKAASRKNMMSISGMISMRPRLCGNGETSFIIKSALVLVLGGVDEDLGVGAGGLQQEGELGDLGREIIQRDQADDGNGQTAGGGDERFRDTTGNRLHGKLGRAQLEEGAHEAGDRAEQTEQRRERHDRVHDHEETTRALDLDTGGNLQSALERGVVMIQAVPDNAEDRVFGSAGQAGGDLDVVLLECGVDFVQLIGVAFPRFRMPPQRAFDDDGECCDGGDQDRIHDPASLDKQFDNKVLIHFF